MYGASWFVPSVEPAIARTASVRPALLKRSSPLLAASSGTSSTATVPSSFVSMRRTMYVCGSGWSMFTQPADSRRAELHGLRTVSERDVADRPALAVRAAVGDVLEAQLDLLAGECGQRDRFIDPGGSSPAPLLPE